jgi:hypothetical protein
LRALAHTLSGSPASKFLAAKMVEMPGFWGDNKGIRSPQVLMMFRRALLLAAVASLGASLAAQQQQAQKPDSKAADPDVLVLKPPPPPPGQQQKPALRAVDLQSRPKLDDVTKMRLIQLLDADLVHTRKYLPLGDKNTKITPEGLVTPNDSALFQSMQAHGAAAKVGDKVQITNIVFHEKSVYVEINGGPKKKSKWYQHISISGAGGGVAAPDDPNAAQPTGAAVTLEFDKYVPEMNGDELQKLLSPVLDFSVKSAAEVYIETMPPKIREAMKKHEVLVGMNKDMVIMAMDRPQQKVREKDENGKEYEEWIYGAPPKDVVFVRFKGDEVTRVETAKVGGEMIVKDKKEVDVKDGVVALATLQASGSPQDVKTDQGAQPQTPTKRPTLRREGEAPDPSVRRAPAQTQTPSDHGDEPQWGSDKKDGDSQPSGQQQPPL